MSSVTDDGLSCEIADAGAGRFVLRTGDAPESAQLRSFAAQTLPFLYVPKDGSLMRFVGTQSSMLRLDRKMRQCGLRSRYSAAALDLISRAEDFQRRKANAYSASAGLQIPGLVTQPWAHQLAGSYTAMGGASVYFSMRPGTGKSLTTIGALCAAQHRRVLVLCPRSVIRVWPRELNYHAPGVYAVHSLEKGSVKEKVEQANQLYVNLRGPLMLVVNYDSFRVADFAKWAQAKRWDAVVCDESHRCFRAGTMISTPNGLREIEAIRAGDMVYGFDHVENRVVESRVVSVMSSAGVAKKIGPFSCTNDHPIYVYGRGYVDADCVGMLDQVLTIGDGDAVDAIPVAVPDLWGRVCDQEEVKGFLQSRLQSASSEDCLPFLRRGISSSQRVRDLLQQVVHGEAFRCYSRGEVASIRSDASNDCSSRGSGEYSEAFDGRNQSFQESLCSGGSMVGDEIRRKAVWEHAGRQRTRSDGAAGDSCESAWMGDGVCCPDWYEIAESLQAGCGESGYEDRRRGGRCLAFGEAGYGVGRQEVGFLEFGGLEAGSFFEFGGSGGPRLVLPEGAVDGECRVYNLTTETENYFAESVLVHNCKSPFGMTSKAVHKLYGVSGQRFCLSGTPMPHDPLDIWSQCAFLDPGLFGTSFVRFRNRYAKLGFFRNVESFVNLDELSELFAMISFHVGEEVLSLPPVTHVMRSFSLRPATMKAYEKLRTELAAEFQGETVIAANTLVKAVRLQQISSGFLVNDDGAVVDLEDRGKIDLFAEILEDQPKGEPLVVCTRFHHDLDAVRQVTEARGLKYGELSGRRNDLGEDAKMPEGFDVFAVNIASGGVGIDLTRSCHAVVFSLSWSAGDYDQFLHRLKRPGQEKHVTFTHLVAERTIDDAIYGSMRHKQGLSDAAMREAVVNSIRSGSNG